MYIEVLNEITNKLNVSSRIKIIIIISLILMISHSLFLTLSMIVLVVMILTLYNKNVKYYINTLKNICIWLILIQLIYIIISESIVDSFIFIFKFILVLLLLNNLILTTTFGKIHSGLEKCLSVFSILAINIEKLSYEISVFIFYTKYLIESKTRILKMQNLKTKIIRNSKNLLVPSIVLSTNKIQNLERSLIIDHYKLKKENRNILSSVFECLFLTLLIVVIIKEVIL